jgi:hypothetical protein
MSSNSAVDRAMKPHLGQFATWAVKGLLDWAVYLAVPTPTERGVFGAVSAAMFWANRQPKVVPFEAYLHTVSPCEETHSGCHSNQHGP